MKAIIKLLLLACICSNVFSQNKDSVNVNVYIKCSFCDESYIRNEIKMINYVRDFSEANVIVLGMSEETGSGGEKYRLIFEGKKQFEGINDTLIFESQKDATAEEIRDLYIKYFKIGILSYILKTPLRKSITYSITEQNLNQLKNMNTDKWKNWVFSISSSGWFNGEQSNQSYNVNSNFQISKVLEHWKFNFSYNQSYSKSKFSYDEYKYEYINRSNNASLYNVWSLSSHWSAGIFSSAGSSTYGNYKLYWNLLPALEYNVFPYEQSFQKQFRFDYRIGLKLNKYNDTTIFNKIEEFNGFHQLNISFSLFKKWGNIDISMNGNQYFHDLSFFSLGMYSGFNIRIAKGFSVYFYGGYSMIRNQINLAKQDVSQEELLLRQRQMKTNYSFWGNIGLSYTFGSKYNNIVNPRFD